MAIEFFFARQYETRDYTTARSSRFQDVDYGPGWYVTQTPPTAPTDMLLEELWQGRLENTQKTAYWLKLLTNAQRLKVPDINRPGVAYLPIYNGLGGDANRPAGINTEPVLLTEGGVRRQDDSGQPVVTQEFSSRKVSHFLRCFL